jgi:hypothetical protein
LAVWLQNVVDVFWLPPRYIAGRKSKDKDAEVKNTTTLYGFNAQVRFSRMNQK